MDTVNPLVSVLMSVYNEDTVLINEAIESIINQSFKDFECIIIGDNPINDRVINIIKDFSRKDKRISFYVNEKNMAVSIQRRMKLGTNQCFITQFKEGNDYFYKLKSFSGRDCSKGISGRLICVSNIN